MRTDLSQDFINKKNSTASEPRTLAVFKFPILGNIYISDVQISLGGVTYQALVSNWGSIEEAADPEEINSEVRQQTITLINSGSAPFTDYFLTDSPENVEVELYQWFVGLEDYDKVLIDRFIIQDPIEFDENSQTVSLDLVSLSLRYDGFVGPVLSKSDWPSAKDSDVGKPIDYIVGSPGPVKTLAASVGRQTTLDGPIVPRSISITVNDSLTGWLSPGTVIIDSEEIYFQIASGKTITAKVRGYGGTIAADHSDGATVYQKIPHQYIVGQGPLLSIDNVLVAGRQPPSSMYYVQPATNPAKIIFSSRPYSIKYSDNTELESLSFDTVASGNTALKPYQAFDVKPSTSAVINENNRFLIIKKTIPYEDLGQISKAFLVVKHWASNLFLNDRAGVYFDGNLLGYLDRPSSEDNLVIEAEVDIDHGHEHETGDFHTHTHDDGSYSAAVGQHKHALLGSGTDIIVPTSSSLPVQIQNPGKNRYTDFSLNYTWTDPGGTINSAYLEFVAFQLETEIEIFEGGQPVAYYSRVFNNLNTEVVLNAPITSVFIRVHGTEVQGNTYARISKATLHLNYSADMENARGTVSPYLSQQGTNRNAYNTNKNDDVKDFTDNNRAVAISNELPTKLIETKFDILDLLPDPTVVDWDYLSNKTVNVTYFGTVDNVSIYLTDISIEAYYKKSIKEYSDDVTCEPVAQTINRPNNVIYDLLINKAFLPTSYIDSQSFNDIGQKYINNGYFLNGIIKGDQNVRDAIKNILRQSRSRLIWNAGKAKLLFREFFSDWELDKTIQPADLQLKSISARRQKIADIENKITIFYNKRWDNDYYRSAEVKSDPVSISRNGIREKRDSWEFDLVTTQAMASDLAEFYISTLAKPSTFYDINTYLNQFELEKEDILQITSSGFNQMVKLPVVIRAANRVFGSAESSQINLINLIVESFRFIKLQISLGDFVGVTDSINILIGLLLDFSAEIVVSDNISFYNDVVFDDYVAIDDSLSTISDFESSLSDTISLIESARVDPTLNFNETIYITDFIGFSRSIGYGSGGYGIETGYGGIIDLDQRNTDMIGPTDIIAMDIGAILADSQSIADEIAFSDGYGSQKFGGYGTSPYGS